MQLDAPHLLGMPSMKYNVALSDLGPWIQQHNMRIMQCIVYVLLALFIAGYVMPTKVATAKILIWLLSNPISKIVMLVAIYLAASKDVIMAFLLIVLYVIIDYDLYMSGKYFNKVDDASVSDGPADSNKQQ